MHGMELNNAATIITKTKTHHMAQKDELYREPIAKFPNAHVTAQRLSNQHTVIMLNSLSIVTFSNTERNKS
jgi:hypothetical protein